MADSLINGIGPYSDFFLADPPILVFFLAIIKYFTPNLLVFSAVPFILESITAFILFIILKNRGNNFAWLAPLIYLFSFTIAATSDFLTGLQLTSLFIVLSIYYFDKRRYIKTGFFFALSIFTKLYALPAFIGLLVYLYLNKEHRNLFRVIVGFTIVALAIFFYALYSDLWRFIEYVIIHHLNRPNGISKVEVLLFFLKKEWLIMSVGIIGAFIYRKRFLFFPLIFSIIFLLLFKDLYYVYLGILMPFLVILGLQVTNQLSLSVGYLKKISYVLVLLYIIIGGQYFLIYKDNFNKKGIFINAPEIAAYILSINNDVNLYGSHEIAPLIALMTDKKIINNVIDTNTQSFSSDAQNLMEISDNVAERGGYLIARAIHYPEQDVFDYGFEGYFDPDVFRKYCRRLKEFMDMGGDATNQIVVYRCQK